MISDRSGSGIGRWGKDKGTYETVDIGGVLLHLELEEREFAGVVVAGFLGVDLYREMQEPRNQISSLSKKSLARLG